MIELRTVVVVGFQTLGLEVVRILSTFNPENGTLKPSTPGTSCWIAGWWVNWCPITLVTGSPWSNLDLIWLRYLMFHSSAYIYITIYYPYVPYVQLILPIWTMHNRSPSDSPSPGTGVWWSWRPKAAEQPAIVIRAARRVIFCPTYPLVMTNSLLLKMAIEIVDFPMNSMVIFNSYVSLPEGNDYQCWISMFIKHVYQWLSTFYQQTCL